MVVPVELLADSAETALYLGIDSVAIDVLLANEPAVCHG